MNLKILFVCSGNSKEGISPIIKNQGESFKKAGIIINYFTIKGKGLLGYLRNIFPLKKEIRKNSYDLIHAHYVLSAWVVLLSSVRKPIVVSYMGSDTYGNVDLFGKRVFKSYFQIITAKLLQPFVNIIIVKSKNLEKYIYCNKKCRVIPNGVNFKKFYYSPDNNFKKELNLKKEKIYILFIGDNTNTRKNFELAEKAVKIISNPNIELINPYPIAPEAVPKYLNSVDILLFTSFIEGSPNVIKESMACNCPIVSTDVGDVRWVFGETEGCYITSYKPKDVAESIQKAISFGRRTTGRERIKQLELDSESVAQRIIAVYNKVLNC